MAVVIVTGTSTGIGLATALHFARAGHDVNAAVRNPDTAVELNGAIARQRLPIHVLTLDVDDAGSVERGVRQVLERAGRVDILVNNAGIGGGGPIEDVPVDWAKTLFETNYFGVIRTTQAVLPGMRRQRSGVIVNISSIAGRVAIAGHGHYCAVKHALEAASEALAQEVQGFGIRVAIVESKLASQPADAAAVIYEAATTKTPRLRWRVGEDARLLDEGRRRMTDEEFIAGARPMPDAEYIAEMARRFGFKWTATA